MKGKAKKGDLRDICGTVCCPNAVFAYLRATKCSAVLMLSLPFFISHVKGVVISKIIKKTETLIVIIFSFISPQVSECLFKTSKYVIYI
jgi:hypothetical protein